MNATYDTEKVIVEKRRWLKYDKHRIVIVGQARDQNMSNEEGKLLIQIAQMYYLENKGIQNISAIIDYPLIKETKNVSLGDDDRKTLKKVINDIEKISKYDKPPEILNNSICKKCSYFDLCYI